MTPSTATASSGQPTQSIPANDSAGILALARIRALTIDSEEVEELASALDDPRDLGYPLGEPRGTVILGEQLVSDGLLAAAFPDRANEADDFTAAQLAIVEMVTDRAADQAEDLLEFYEI